MGILRRRWLSFRQPRQGVSAVLEGSESAWSTRGSGLRKCRRNASVVWPLAIYRVTAGERTGAVAVRSVEKRGILAVNVRQVLQ